jgi:hypothetical protein
MGESKEAEEAMKKTRKNLELIEQIKPLYKERLKREEEAKKAGEAKRVEEIDVGSGMVPTHISTGYIGKSFPLEEPKKRKRRRR